jgi:DNA-binding response OmpR family regulator
VLLRILTIDDNKTITDMISEYLNSCGHSCVVSNDGREGLSLILKQSFDAILLDLTMPKFSGFDIIESLVQTGKIKGQKILVFSADDVKEDEIKKLKAKGVYGSIHKTTDMNTLEKTVRSMVDKSS